MQLNNIILDLPLQALITTRNRTAETTPVLGILYVFEKYRGASTTEREHCLALVLCSRRRMHPSKPSAL